MVNTLDNNGRLNTLQSEFRGSTARTVLRGRGTLQCWLSRIDKDAKVARNKRIFEARMACYTQEEIAEMEGTPRETVRNTVDEFGHFGNLADSTKAVALLMVDCKPEFYSVWKWKEKTPGSAHPRSRRASHPECLNTSIPLTRTRPPLSFAQKATLLNSPH